MLALFSCPTNMTENVAVEIEWVYPLPFCARVIEIQHPTLLQVHIIPFMKCIEYADFSFLCAPHKSAKLNDRRTKREMVKAARIGVEVRGHTVCLSK